MLAGMSSAELSEWIAFYRVRNAPETSDVDSKLRKIFGRPSDGR